ncbi:MAG: bifunctional aminoglycoside phosphotransferase/ATP-binding protein [Planctomycetota bacterium]
MSDKAFADDPLVADLSRPENLPGEPRSVEFLFTHGSFVFRTPRDVYKVKRAKDYGFFDYSTLAARKHFCEEELRLNRRTAPEVYLDVLPVTRDARGHAIGRTDAHPGETVDWAVHMATLPDDRSALWMLRGGTLSAADLSAAAARLARFYASAHRHTADPGAMRKNLEENFDQVRPYIGRFIDQALFDDIRDGQLSWLEESADLLAARPARDGHGDLRLEHLYLMPSGPVVIDCIEFLDRFRIADPALDIAFLAMDLRRESRADLAEHLLARFAYESDDYDLYPLIDGYVSYRAYVRAKVACFVAADEGTDAETAARKAGETLAMFALARDALSLPRPAPRVVAVGGPIASGKTTLAEALAERDGMAHVSADATRKHLGGLAHDERGDEALYTDAFTEHTMNELLRRAEQVLLSGRGVVIDTTFRDRGLRERAHALADKHRAAFLMVECRVPEELQRERLRARTGGVSDAREELLDRFTEGFEPIDELPPSQHLVLDTSHPLDGLIAAVPPA